MGMATGVVDMDSAGCDLSGATLGNLVMVQGTKAGRLGGWSRSPLSPAQPAPGGQVGRAGCSDSHLGEVPAGEGDRAGPQWRGHHGGLERGPGAGPSRDERGTGWAIAMDAHGAGVGPSGRRGWGKPLVVQQDDFHGVAVVVGVDVVASTNGRPAFWRRRWP